MPLLLASNKIPRYFFAKLHAAVVLVAGVIAVTLFVFLAVESSEKLINLFGRGIRPAFILHIPCELGPQGIHG